MNDRSKQIRKKMEEIESSLDELRVMVMEAIEGLPAHVREDTRRNISASKAAAYLGIHYTNLVRLAQAGLLPHDRQVGKGGGEHGMYRFSGADLADIQPHVQERITQARRILESRGDEKDHDRYVERVEVYEETGLTPRLLKRLSDSGRVRSYESSVEGEKVEKFNLGDVQRELAKTGQREEVVG